MHKSYQLSGSGHGEVVVKQPLAHPEYPSVILYKTAPINNEKIPYNFRDFSLYNPQSLDASNNRTGQGKAGSAGSV
jgi:hypothetical protein